MVSHVQGPLDLTGLDIKKKLVFLPTFLPLVQTFIWFFPRKIRLSKCLDPNSRCLLRRLIEFLHKNWYSQSFHYIFNSSFKYFTEKSQNSLINKVYNSKSVNICLNIEFQYKLWVETEWKKNLSFIACTEYKN